MKTDNQKTLHRNHKPGDSKPEKITKWEKLFLGLAWLLITLVLYWRLSDLAPEQSYLYILYPFFSAYLIAGAWYHAWYLVTFRITVGYLKFFLAVFIQIFLLVLTIIAAEKGIGGVKLFLLLFIFSIAHVGFVVILYKNAIKAHGSS